MSDGFKFKKIEGGMALERFFSDPDEKIIIPDTIDGENVIAINNSAFADYIQIVPRAKYITEIILPEKLQIIGSSAFRGFNGLKKIEFPDTLELIKQDAFRGCVSLKEITLPEKLEKIGASSFENCNSLNKVVVLNNDMVVGKSAFLNSNNLQDVSFHLIKSLDVDNQVILLKEYFSKWDNLESDVKAQIITMSKKKALKNALFLASDITTINVLFDEKFKPSLDDVNQYLEYYTKLDNTQITAILLNYKDKKFSKKQVDTLKERNELVDIGLELPTFTELRKLWTISKVEGNIRISGYKGEDKNAVIPKTLADGTLITEIIRKGYGVFSNLETLRIEADLTTIGAECFSGCYDLTEIVLPNSITKIEYLCFNHCKSLKVIHLPENLEIIRYKAFMDCESLEEIVIPASVKVIENRAFWYCKSLKKVTFLGDTPEFGDSVFLDTPYGDNQ